MAKDYYDILGVAKNATQDDIKKAYRRLAHQYHPDKDGGNEQKFKEVNEAYQVLGNPDKRKTFDQFGTSGFSGQGAPGGFNWQDFSQGRGQQGFGGFGQNVEFDLNDLFGDFFGFGGKSKRSRRRSSKGNIEAEITVDFLEAVFGVEKTIVLDRYVTCSHCSGNGAEPGSKIETCATCKGVGEVQQVQQTILGQFATRAVCPTCEGEGKTMTKKCSRCGGEGRIRQEQTLKIKIPAGINEGEQIRLQGQGQAGTRGGETGDLFLTIHVREDSRFVREGDDIFTKIEISITDAVLGTAIMVETVDGPVKLKIPSGTESGKVFQLKGKGVPRLRSRGKGNHLVTVELKIPKKLDREQKRLLEELHAKGL